MGRVWNRFGQLQWREIFVQCGGPSGTTLGVKMYPVEVVPLGGLKDRADHYQS